MNDATLLAVLLTWAGVVYATIAFINIFLMLRKRQAEIVAENYSEICDFLIKKIADKFLKIVEIQIGKNPNIINLYPRKEEMLEFFLRDYGEKDINFSNEYEELMFVLKKNLPDVIYAKVKSADALIVKAMKYKEIYKENPKQLLVKKNNIVKQLKNKIKELDKVIVNL